MIESSRPAQEMAVDPAGAFNGRLTEAQDFKVYSVGAHPFGCERIGDLDSTAAGGEDAVYGAPREVWAF